MLSDLCQQTWINEFGFGVMTCVSAVADDNSSLLLSWELLIAVFKSSNHFKRSYKSQLKE